MTTINVLLFSASLLWQRIKNLVGRMHARAAKDLYVVVGGNDHNILLLKSLKKPSDRESRGILLAKADGALRDKLYMEGIPYLSFDGENCDCAEFYKKIKSFIGGRSVLKTGLKKNITVIVNTENDERNLLFVRETEKLLHAEIGQGRNSLKGYKRLIDVPVNARSGLVLVYSFCRIENLSAFNDPVKNSRGHIRLLNRYEQIALDFTEKYPLTRFMTDEQIDFDKGLIKDAEINVCLVGFGPMNQQIFLKTVSDAQFFTEKNNRIEHKKVHYYVFDKKEADKDKNLNQTYFRYSLEFYKEYWENVKKFGKDVYLPLPDYPADDWYNPDDNEDLTEHSAQYEKHFFTTDINSYRFYDCLKTVLDGEKSFNYIIVAFGEDLENIDLAKKISARLEMWGSSRHTHIFAKVRSGALALKTQTDSDNGDGIITFGSTESVYDLIKIAEDPIREMAYLKSFSYSRASYGDTPKERKKNAVNKWMNLSVAQQNGNYYSCLNLRTKLNLIGLDYAKQSAKEADAEKEFFTKYYGTDDKDEVENLRGMFEGEYDPAVFTDGSVRTGFARQEHQRWNANYICCGIVPPLKREIDGRGGGTDLEKRMVHCNLTTFEGLEEYGRIIANSRADGQTERKDVRRYDYKIMDCADRILSDAGYKIVSKKQKHVEENFLTEINA